MFAKFFCLVVDFLTSEGKFLQNDDNERQHIKNGSHIFKYLCLDKTIVSLWHFSALDIYLLSLCKYCGFFGDGLMMFYKSTSFLDRGGTTGML